MVVTTFFFVCVHATAKYLVQTYPVPQVVFGRFFVHLVIAALILGPRLKGVLAVSRPGLQLARSGFMLGATFLYFFGVRSVPLAEANSIMFLCPIIVALLAGPLLGESVGLRRWIGVAFGFAGVLIIVRPGSDLWQLAALILLGSATCNAFYQMSTRQLRGSDDPTLTLFFTPLAGTVAGALALPFFWQTPDTQGWLLFALIGAFAAAGHFALIKAFSLMPAPVAAPFGYLNLIWSIGFGYLLFGDWPDLWTFAGAAVIMASGLYILHRERVRKLAGVRPTRWG
jgi:drug/metabolite transporter (DMT)-like permease